MAAKYNTMELVLLSLTTLFVGYSAIAPEYRNNSLYTFNIDKDGTVIVMNTQTGQLHRCTRQFECTVPANVPKDAEE